MIEAFPWFYIVGAFFVAFCAWVIYEHGTEV